MKDTLGHDWEVRIGSHYSYVCRICRKTDMDPGVNRPCSPGKKTVKVEPGCLIKCGGEWWRVVKINDSQGEIHGHTIIHVIRHPDGHATDSWEAQYIEDVKAYDGPTIEVEINE